MNANDVIECYVTDVAVKLPRKQRNDVALELRTLLTEGLQDKSASLGRDVDAAMATEFVNAFGRPAEVAARYRPTLTVIDPADGHAFVRASVIGLAIIWCVGLLVNLWQSADSGWDIPAMLGKWWLGTVIPSLWWPGALVVAFALASWTRRRQPQTLWKVPVSDRPQVARAGQVVALVGILCGIFLLINPRWVLDYFWGGQADPAAYAALTYTDTFRKHQAPWLLGVIMLNVPLLITVIAAGRWSDNARRFELGLALAGSAVMIWTILGGPIFVTPESDRAIKFSLILTVVFTLAGKGVKYYRQVRPAKN